LAARYSYEKRWALSWPASWLLAIKPAALLLLVTAMAWLAVARGRAARGEP